MSTGAERATTLRQTDTAIGEVISNTVLTAPGKPIKRHIGTSILERLTLEANFLQNLNCRPVRPMSPAIIWRCAHTCAGFAPIGLIHHPSSLPVNPIRDVKRVLSRFRLSAEQEVHRALWACFRLC